jgi:hypothetical protein
MNARALLVLQWIRNMNSDDQFSAGYTVGFLRAIDSQMEAWESAYLNNVLRARQRGITA